MTIGEALRAARESSGLTMAEAARRAGMTRQQLYSIETGRRADPAWSSVVRLAEVLEVELSDIAARASASC